MAKQVSVEIEVNSSQVDQTVKKLGQLKDLGRGLKIQYDIDGRPIDVAIDKSLNLQKQVKVLTAELRRTKEGTAEFQLLSTKLGDAQDQLAKTTAKSKDLFTSLSMIPGPVGQFFSQLQGGIELLKTFSSFTFKDLQFQFKETANDIADIGKNLGAIDTSNIDNIKESTDEANQSFRDAVSDSADLARTQTIIQNKRLNEYETEVAAIKNLEAAQKKGNVAKGFQIGLVQDEVNKRGLVPGVIKQTIDAEGNLTETTRVLTQSEIQLAAANKNVTVTTEGMVVAEKAATFWTTTLGTTIKTVLISTGILAAIVVIGELVSMIYRWVTSSEDAEAATRSLTGAIEEQQRVLQNDLDAIDMANKANITRAKIAGKTEAEISKIVIQGGQERLDALREYDEQLYKDQELLNKNTKISSEDRLKLGKDINDRILKNGQDITKQILTNEQFRLDEQLRVAEKGREGSKKIQEKKVDDTKLANEMLLELNKENALAAIADERTRQYRELELQAATEVDKVNALKVSEEKKGELRNQIFLKYAKKQIDLKKKFDDEDIKKIQEQGQKVADYAGKLEDMRIAAIEDANLKEVEQRRNKYSEDVKDLDKALKDKLLTQQQYNAAILNLQKSLDNDLKKIEDDKKKKENDDKIKKLDDDIRFLEISNNAQKNSFVAYWQGRQEILDAAEQRELAALNLTEDQKHAIEKKYVQLSKDLQREKFQAYLGYVSAGLSAVAGFYSQQQTINGLAMDNELAKVKDNAVEQDKIKEKYFYKNQKAQKGQAVIATLQSAIQAFSALAGIPVVGPVLGAAAAAAALVFGYKQVDLIGKQTYQSSLPNANSAEAAKPAMPNFGKNYEKGGMIGGKRHAEGGTLIEAEKGEAIMTRGAVTMFAPLLSTLNQMGGGTSFAPSLMTTSFDAPITAQPSQEQAPIIVKSYVVSSELTTEQNKQARLKDLSTL
jgi:hypothetical protein